jgi:hypothetical protein
MRHSAQGSRVQVDPDRDRFIDLVRVASMVVVVVLWLSGMPALTAGRVVEPERRRGDSRAVAHHLDW